MRGDGGGPVVSNAAVIQRNREKQAQRQTLGRQQRKLQERKSARGPPPVVRPLFFERKSASGPPPVAHPLVQKMEKKERKITRRGGGNVLGGSGGESRLLDRPAKIAGLSVWFKDRSRTCQAIPAGGRRHKELAKQRHKIFATKAVCDSRR
jgi:hypothetical protein